MKKIIFVSISVVVIYVGCQKKSNKYEIIDSKHNPKNNVSAYSVYTPDTNWIEMEKFAKDLLKDKDKHSAVVFSNPKEMAVKFKENWGMINTGYIVAVYGYAEERKKTIFEKDSNRFRPEMHFEKSK